MSSPTANAKKRGNTSLLPSPLKDDFSLKWKCTPVQRLPKMSRRADCGIPNLFATEPDASICNHELDYEEIIENGEDKEFNEYNKESFHSNPLSDATISIIRGGSFNEGNSPDINN